jgi:hypothetical protein
MERPAMFTPQDPADEWCRLTPIPLCFCRQVFHHATHEFANNQVIAQATMQIDPAFS